MIVRCCEYRNLSRSIRQSVRRYRLNDTSPSEYFSSRTARKALSTSSPKCLRKVHTTDSRRTPARTRFAPSPTGFLHLGSLRTAIFNYLLARKTGGQFILRIEDTDKRRTVVDAEARLCNDLRWAGLQWDEGPEVGGPYFPYRQSDRLELYRYHANELIKSGDAYRCFCPVQDPQSYGHEAFHVGVKVSACRKDCKTLPAATIEDQLRRRESFVVRFLPRNSHVIWRDSVYGKVANAATREPENFSNVADSILLKSDGSPTYHLANVVDDHDMRITNVIRGTEWMPSTALHIALYQAFQWQPPVFSHVSLLTDEGHNKLSKRNFDVDVSSLVQTHGLLPEALVNYLLLLGWSNPSKKDVMTRQEMIDRFDMKFTKGDTVVTTEKLFFLQRQHARLRITQAANNEKDSHLLEPLVAFLSRQTKVAAWDADTKLEILGSRQVSTYLRAILLVDPGTYETPRRYLDQNSYFFRRRPASNLAANDEVTSAPGDVTQAEASDQSPRTGRPHPQHVQLTYRREVEKFLRSIIDGEDSRRDFNFWDNLGEDAPSARSLDIAMSTFAARSQARLKKMLKQEISAIRHAESINSLDEEADVSKTEEYKVMNAEFHRYTRLLLSGKTDGLPNTFRVMAVLGYDECKRRIGEFV